MNLLERINRVINDPLFEEVLVSRGLTLETFREDIRVWSLHPTVETAFKDLPEAYRTAIATVEERAIKQLAIETGWAKEKDLHTKE